MGGVKGEGEKGERKETGRNRGRQTTTGFGLMWYSKAASCIMHEASLRHILQSSGTRRDYYIDSSFLFWGVLKQREGGAGTALCFFKAKQKFADVSFMVTGSFDRYLHATKHS